MFTHPQVWQAIDELARRRHWSVSRLAVRSNLDPTALNLSKRIGRDGKPRWPSTHTLALLLQATGTSLSDFSALIEAPIAAAAGLADILVVDDDSVQRQGFAAILRGAGYRVHDAADHHAVVDLIEREQPID